VLGIHVLLKLSGQPKAWKIIKMRGAVESVFYNAQVLMTIKQYDLRFIPKPGLVLESPAGAVYTLRHVADPRSR